MKFDRSTWEAWLACQGLADRTIRTYTQYAIRYVRWAKTTKQTAPHALAVRAWSHTLPVGASTRKNARVAIAHLCEYVGVPDCSGAVARPEKSARRLRMPLSRRDASKLMGHAHTMGHEGTAVITALCTGARISELRYLHWLDFDWSGGVVRFFRPKTDDRHSVPISDLLADRLAPERPDDPARAGYVFGTPTDGRRSDQSMRDWIGRVTDGCGLGWVQPHDLRRTAGRAVYEASGRDITVVQKFLGHADAEQSSVYIRVDLDAVREALDGVDFWTWDDDDGMPAAA